jgi:hypothetical protein
MDALLLGASYIDISKVMKDLYLLHFKKVLLAAYETYTCDACRTRLVAAHPKRLLAAYAYLAAYETYRGGAYIRHATHVGRA